MNKDRLQACTQDPRLLEIQAACQLVVRLDAKARLLRDRPSATFREVLALDDRIFAAEERARAALRHLRDLVGDEPCASYDRPSDVSDARILAAWESSDRSAMGAARELGIPTHWVQRAVARLVGRVRAPRGSRHAG